MVVCSCTQRNGQQQRMSFLLSFAKACYKMQTERDGISSLPPCLLILSLLLLLKYILHVYILEAPFLYQF